MSRNKLLSGIAVFVFAAFLVYGMAGSGEMQQVEQQQTAQTAASELSPLGFKLKNVNGDLFDMNSLKGKVVLIDFWDTWCPPCKKGIPEFVEMKEKYKDNENFEIVGIAFGRDGFETVQKFAKEYEMNYPVLVLDNDQYGNIMQVYGSINSIPTAFIINKEGKIQFKQQGYAPASAFEEAVIPLLDK
ncbi:TlpA family protein disulfide reductase [candidate division KSB1 bacterium]